MKNINDRFRNLVMQVTSDSRRYKELEELTGISGSTWKTFWTRGGFPSAQMLEAINVNFPQYAFWLATGITDSAHGHIGPNVAYEAEINLREKPDQISCIHYIRQKNAINRQLSKENRTELKKAELDEIYNFRCARDTERLGYLTRQTAHRKNEVVGYFEPRMLKYLDPSDGSEN